MNVELLQQIRAAILAEPDAFRMDVWSCGTAHCIAGWALKLNDVKLVNIGATPARQKCEDGRLPLDVAAALLGLSTHADDEDWTSYSEAERLFYRGEWPSQFTDRYVDTDSRSDRAQIAADRIDHFIATEGRE